MTSRARPPSTLTTPRSKVTSFLQFLDEVEDGHQDLPSAATSATSVVVPALSIPTQVQQQPVVWPVLDTVRSRIATLESEVAEKDRALRQLQETVTEMQSRGQRDLAESATSTGQQLQDQQTHFQEIINKHVQFIDRLLADKRELTNKVEALGKQLQSLEADVKRRLADASRKAADVLRIEKEKWAAMEKVNREKWQQVREKELKEMTVRGLEPELRRLMAKAEQDMKMLEEKHKSELAQEKELAERAVRRVQEHQEQEIRDKLKAVQTEHAEELDRQRRSLTQEFDLKMQATRAAFERERQQLSSELELCREGLTQKLRRAEDAARDELARKHAEESARSKADMESEREQWRLQQQRKLETEFREREEAMRRDLNGQRDKQVEAVVAKLEEDLHTERQTAEQRVRDAEGRAMAQSMRIQEWRDKHAEAERARRAAEKELASLREQQNRETPDGTATIRLQEQIRRLQEEAIAQKRRAAREAEEVQRMHEEELAQKDEQLEALETRVRKAIATRDETIAILRTEIDRQKRELEAVLQQQ